MAKGVCVITLKRLILRGIDETDTEAIVKWRSEPEVYKYFKFPHRITAEEHLRWYNNRYLLNENRFDWICLEKESGNRIGVFGLIKESNKVEVSYLLASEAQHKGYASEAILGLIRYASTTWGIKQVIAEIHKDNNSSIFLVEKLGFHIMNQKTPFIVYELDI